MLTWIAVGIGGALGAMARHGVNRAVHQGWPSLQFPLATAIVNVSGCCVFGVLAGLIATGRLPMRITAREFVFVGILGGFTTFSTFGSDTVTLLRHGALGQAALNVVGQTALGVGGLYAGLMLAERLTRTTH